MLIAARDAKKVKDKIKKLASKVESEDFDDEMELVSHGIAQYLLQNLPQCRRIELHG